MLRPYHMPDDPGPEPQPQEPFAMNANLFHNILNIAFLIIGVLVTFDWTVFGFDAAVTVKIVGALVLVQILYPTAGAERATFTSIRWASYPTTLLVTILFLT